ncbi:Acyl-CoA synthetase (AMP-forming)/AMP-acid ligase II [Eubacterium aggregans]|uniref:Acyl-CoA synthetase (AMP-forming)/AMP-acid ligase II n=1 Tax=Eubacterium aggregans TaxID=81409 RepID=A0A1H3WVF1_9FIRM|nr:AMP-binding protein [Eubacterium aggregans]SDZ90344.1 Acyl-CoA synthetase (AMP-forming)/AMP-acid ligase II [Eubacterium aggregans]
MTLFKHDPIFNHRVLAIMDEGREIDYQDIDGYVQKLKGVVQPRTLCFILCENKADVLLFYLAALRMDAVPLLLNDNISSEALRELINLYRPAFLLSGLDHEEINQMALCLGRIEFITTETVLYRIDWPEQPPLHPDLALLLTTSGSTGSSKVVRLSKCNLQSNAEAIAQYLELEEDDRPVTTLPMSYTYGLSVIHSHLLVGATLLLTTKSVTERGFWEFCQENKGTSLAGVPYTYEMMDRLKIDLEQYPYIRTLTQAGGHLSEALQERYAQWSSQDRRRFVIMYGQTEATARMAYLPPEAIQRKLGSIGIPIPGGAFELVDTDGSRIEGDCQRGELVYTGPNVAMGYAECAQDLVKGDEWQGRLCTGDLAKRDSEGYYYIVGRKSRFVKLYGYRVSLDEIENNLTAHFPGYSFACIGHDAQKDLVIFTTDRAPKTETAVTNALVELTRLPSSVFKVYAVEAIPMNASGKKDYVRLEKRYHGKD